jgi:hypothetical protein
LQGIWPEAAAAAAAILELQTERKGKLVSKSIDRSLSPENRYVVLEEEKQFSRCVTGGCMQRD